jgi:hypothetical protein
MATYSGQMAGQVGPSVNADGAAPLIRLDKTGATVTQNASALYREAVLRGSVFGVCNQSGITTQAGLSATTPALTLVNPLGSGKNLILWYAGASFSVAFGGAAAIWLAVNTNVAAAPVTGTLTTAHRNMLLGSANTPSGVPMLAATLPAAPVGLALLGCGLTGAITTVPSVTPIGRWLDGSIILAPGAAVSIQTGAASGASGTFCEFIWEEVTA